MGVELQEDLARFPVRLALDAGSKRRSKHTGFVHFCYNGKGEEGRETIPLFENFTYVLALFLSKEIENINRARGALARLLAFEAEGDFPLYLHEYPVCSSPSLSAHLLAPLYWLLELDPALPGHDLRHDLEKSYRRVLSVSKEKLAQGRLSWNARVKLLAVLGQFDPGSEHPKTPREWADFLIAATLSGQEVGKAFDQWHPDLLTFIGEGGQRFEGAEPEPTLFDLFMGHAFNRFPKRVSEDHPCHLQGALVRPLPPPSQGVVLETPYVISDESHPFGLYWGAPDTLHSLVYPVQETRITIEENELLLTLPETPPVEKEEYMEAAFYLDRHPDLKLLVNGKKGSLFHLKDPVEIVSKGVHMTLQFEVAAGEGTFCGHLTFANRPSQVPSLRKPPSHPYDWKIALRTLRRTSHLQLKATLWDTSREGKGCRRRWPSHASLCRHIPLPL